eukprot:scaffold295277_cov21-Tisochrysis_lutea.AAC.1
MEINGDTGLKGHPSMTRGKDAAMVSGCAQASQVVLLRPPKWQERDTRHWLSSLSLDLLPEEETAPMLENPLRCVTNDPTRKPLRCAHV